MGDRFRIAIVGAGPAGLAAAGRAAELGISHVLLESASAIANTVRGYQRGKAVMAEPDRLPLRCSLSFDPGSRESILGAWEGETASLGINLRTHAAVTAISGSRGDFLLALSSGESLHAERVVLAIGIQGNIRRLEVPGADLPGVQYHLDDPTAYRDETIMVIGGGDAGVENALGLCGRNRVILISRQDEFPNCREANVAKLREAVKNGRLDILLGTTVLRVDAEMRGGFPLALTVQSPQGNQRMPCHRIIARLGATPPRATLEAFGIAFPGDDPAAVPELTEQYESNVPGIHVIGSLAGYPLIKQAMNQGYEVIEHILGHPVEPADQALIIDKLTRIPGLDSVAAGIELVRGSLPLFSALSALQHRDLILDSEILAPDTGSVIFRHNDFGNSFFSIVRGSVDVQIDSADGLRTAVALRQGEFFGEIGLISGRRRSATVIAGPDCILMETPRRAMLRLIDAVPGIQRGLDEVALRRIVRSSFGSVLDDLDIATLIHEARFRRYGVGETLFNEGDAADGLYMIRRGSVTVSRQVDGKELVAAYVSAGSYVGEMALVSNSPRSATVRAAAPTEVVMLEAQRFNEVLDRSPGARAAVAARYMEGIHSREAAAGENSGLIRSLMNQGMGEATDALLIDNSRCIHCDNCEKACAEVHDGFSRVNRHAGVTFGTVHFPASCRHCENPRCMKDCPPDAIHRSPQGEVFILDTCIGCGNCQTNCPYGAIQLVGAPDYRRPGWLDLILGRSPRRTDAGASSGDNAKKAVKCDACREIIGGPACVRACPTGAAFRVSPAEFLALADS